MTEIPDLPSYTCPQIDEVRDFLEEIQAYTSENDFGATRLGDLSAMYELFADGVEQALETLEQIRQANSDLRERQTYFEEENQNYEAKIEELEEKIAELQEELNSL